MEHDKPQNISRLFKVEQIQWNPWLDTSALCKECACMGRGSDELLVNCMGASVQKSKNADMKTREVILVVPKHRAVPLSTCPVWGGGRAVGPVWGRGRPNLTVNGGLASSSQTRG